MPELLDALVPLLLAISLATERLVTIVKTVLPFLAVEQKNDAQEVNLSKDLWRRLTVQAVGIAGSYVTVGLLFSQWGLADTVEVAHVKYRVIVLAVLGSGGSAFWSSLLGYTRALKDAKVVERAATSMEFHARAREQGRTPIDSGVVVGTFHDAVKLPTDAVRAVSAKASAVGARMSGRGPTTGP